MKGLKPVSSENNTRKERLHLRKQPKVGNLNHHLRFRYSGESNMSTEFTIFISHRHKDKALADILSNNLQKWGISQEHIFQSSSPDRGLSGGADVQDELLAKVRETDLFLLIYSQPNDDWWWCSFELGAATAKDTKETTVVVFHCGERLARGAVGGSVQLNIQDEDNINVFAKDFHRRPEFIIPDEATRSAHQPILQSLSSADDKIMRARARELLEDFRKHAPEAHEQERHRWDYMRLSLNAPSVELIRKGEGRDEKPPESYYDLILREVEIRKRTQTSALRRFGYQDFEEGVHLQDLQRRWTNGYLEEFNENPENTRWMDDLCADIYRAIRNISAKRTFNYFKSVLPDNIKCYRPAVIRVRRLVDRSMEFDVYLYRVDEREIEALEALKD